MRKALVVMGIAIIVVSTASAELGYLEAEEEDLLGGGGGGGGGGSSTSSDLIEATEDEVSSLNTSNEDQVESSTRNVSSIYRENVTGMRDAVVGASNLSETVHAARDQAYPNDTAWDGVRTNLSKARGLTPLGDAVHDLYAELGRDLSLLEEERMRENASAVPDQLAQATAVMIYASIDAMHYVDRAFANVSSSNIDTVQGNASTFLALQRAMNFTMEDGNLTLTFTDREREVLRANNNITKNLTLKKLYQASDVLAEAHDEVMGYDITKSTDVSRREAQCTQEEKAVFTWEDCLVVIGSSSNDTYLDRYMARDEWSDRNVVTVDLNGDDTYRSRAGGGSRKYRTSSTGHVQANVDLRAGDDTYERPDNTQARHSPKGAFHGSGLFGVGLAADGGGDDIYRQTSGTTSGTDIGAVHAGSAIFGAGVLIDHGGNDLYRVRQPTVAELSHGQGTARTGFGLLIDEDGRDTYQHEILEDSDRAFNDGGGAQGWATQVGVAYLIDIGADHDKFRGEQALIQGAASQGGFAFVYDDGGPSQDFNISTHPGCPSIDDLTLTFSLEPHEGIGEYCGESDAVPLANWSQAYAGPNAFAALVLGNSSIEAQNDTFAVKPESNPEAGRFRLGVGNHTGAGVFLDVAGNDTYSASSASIGYGNGGVGVFIDDRGEDTYLCGSKTCYGYGEPADGDDTGIENYGGIGTFLDGGLQNDSYERNPDDDGDGVWDRGNLGIGLDVSVDAS